MVSFAPNHRRGVACTTNASEADLSCRVHRRLASGVALSLVWMDCVPCHDGWRLGVGQTGVRCIAASWTLRTSTRGSSRRRRIRAG